MSGSGSRSAAETLVAFTTVGNADDAERIARALVERGLAACVSIVPGVRSIYRWKGAVESEQELLLIIKTRAERFEALRGELVALHPYEVPELIGWPITGGHPAYLDWLAENVR